MSLIWKKSLLGAAQVFESVELAAVSVTKDTVLYGASGYATNATVGSITVFNMIGVVADTVDNSGGSAGDKSALICVDPSAVYEADTTGTPAASQRWTNVTLDAVGTVDEDDPKTAGGTGDTAVAKIRHIVDTTNNKVLVSLNYGPVADA